MRFLILGMLLFTGCAVSPIQSPLKPIERSLIYHPDRYPKGEWTPPANLPIEDVHFQSADGTKLHGWLLERNDPQAVVLYCHGNAGNVTNRLDVISDLYQRHNVSVFVFDYRGFGRSEGKPDEVGILADARAARHWLAARSKVAEGDIIIMGRSLGGGVAVDLVAKDGAAGLVLMSTFASLPEMGKRLAPWMLPKLSMSQRLESINKIDRYHGPLLQSHGTKDRLIPIKQGIELHTKANEPKRFVTIEGGDHNVPWSEAFHREFASLLKIVRYSGS